MNAALGLSVYILSFSWETEPFWVEVYTQRYLLFAAKGPKLCTTFVHTVQLFTAHTTLKLLEDQLT